MLLTISSDRIIFIDGEQRVILPYGELEKNLPEFLYSHLPAEAGLGQSPRITVVNGPGSFTNIRIATLALNTYNMFHGFALDFVSIDKISWYKGLYADKKVPRHCVMYIGQKKNYWVVDLQEIMNYELRITNGGDEIKKIHIDQMKEYVSGLGEDWFVDELVAEGKETMDGLFGEGGYEMYTFADVSLEGNAVKMLEANYMIDANID